MLATPSALEVDDMAGAAGLSKAHFSREFRRAFGESPHHYLLTQAPRAGRRAAADDRLDRRRDLRLESGCRASARSRPASSGPSGRRRPSTGRSQPPAALAARGPELRPAHLPATPDSTFQEDSGLTRD